MSGVAVGTAAEIPPGCAARVVIDGTPVAIFNLDGTFYALDDTCSHQEASLSEGDLDPDRCAIECPLHGWRFEAMEISETGLGGFFRRGKLPPGQGDAALLGYDPHRFAEGDILELAHKREHVARGLAAEAVVELAGGVDVE